MTRTPAMPPETKVDSVKETFHGVEIIDNYRWLEGDVSQPENLQKVTPAVTAWTDAQNNYTRQVLDHLPGRRALEDRLTPLMQIGAVSTPAMRGNRYFLARREGSQNQPVYYWREGARGEDRVLIDPAVLDPTGLTTVEWLSPSQDGKVAAYGTYKSGDENTTLHLIDVDSGTALPLEIPDKTQAPDWLPDGTGFVYQNLKNPKDPYSGQVLFHRMGDPVAKDAILFRQFTKDENEKLSTTWGPWGSLSRDGRWLLLGYWVDTKSNDVWLVDFDKYRKSGTVERTVVSVGVDGHASGTVIDGTLYLHTTKGAPKGQVIAVDAKEPAQAHWRAIVPERKDAVIESVSFAKGRIAVTYLRNASNVIELFDMSGASQGELALPGIGAAGVQTALDRTEAYLQFTSFNYPTTIFQVDLASPKAAPSLWEQPPVPVDPSSVEVEQVWYPSKDGTKISMFLVHKKGVVKTGSVPTLLTGYGGFNVSETPVFLVHYFPWFEDGGLFALPNLRGGGEYGDAWHEGGMLEKKQNVFDDFIAAAEWLVAQGYTRPEKLAISGGSNGGLLTGAALTQRPDLFRAVVVAVPLLDMLRYQHFLMARYWVPEYGSAEKPDEFTFLQAYSPYHHVKTGTRYPAVFLTAGENDSRVHALHARKMAALLQASTAADPGEQPVLIWVDRDSGHGQGKPLALRIRDVADQRMFLMWQLDMLK
ncbi:MAG TPA: prolyl oligopeptidase family serine peptidase [Vicinamibacterales bacterium]|nr:prolyl oligopeptidase family serine peptidase [Vicinamibacterales bacterium]